jgi:hypothetical protein
VGRWVVVGIFLSVINRIIKTESLDFSLVNHDTKHISFTKMSDKNLKFVYLFYQTDTFLFVIETPMLNVNVNILLVGTSTCKTWNIKTITHQCQFPVYLHF